MESSKNKSTYNRIILIRSHINIIIQCEYIQNSAKRRQQSPKQWDRNEIYGFLKEQAGEQVAKKFFVEDIDGRALNFMSIDDISKTMKITIGCAARIKEGFESLMGISK